MEEFGAGRPGTPEHPQRQRPLLSIKQFPYDFSLTDDWSKFPEWYYVEPILDPPLSYVATSPPCQDTSVGASGYTIHDAQPVWGNVDLPGRTSQDDRSMYPAIDDALVQSVTPIIADVGHTVSGQQDPVVPRHSCLVCGELCSTRNELSIHAFINDHATLKCSVHACNYLYTSKGFEYRTHIRTAHPDIYVCDQCEHVGRSQYELALHASSLGHASFACKHVDCEKTFSRIDTYQRHLRTHGDDAKRHPCKYCKKYRGPNGFKRKDHLTQHIRNYHHIGEDDTKGSMDQRKWCPKEGCPEARPAPARNSDNGTFPSSAKWVNHMRTVHDESDFPCPQPHCDRVNGKGYYRKADLRAHLRKVHGTDGHLEDDGM